MVVPVWLRKIFGITLTHVDTTIQYISRMVVSNTLCKFCDSIKFEALGFHDTRNVKSGVPLDRFYEEELGDWSAGRWRPLDEIQDAAEACGFCGKVMEYFREWSSQVFKEEDPDILKSGAFFRFERVICMAEGLFFRLWVTILVPKPSTEGGRYFYVMQFQKCNQQPSTVQDFCNSRSLFDWEESGLEQAFSGRIRSSVADTRLFCKWKETCVGEHHSCMSSFTGERPPWLRLIDVEKRCVVDCFLHEEWGYFVGFNTGITYVALSYVWGNCKQMPELDNSTEKQFREPWSLMRETVLSTIDDAIEVVQGLGEKYLWVDCLCIRQGDEADDEADKGKFIPHMNLIYGFASVTIVAAAGVDANAGLPGVKHDSSPTRRKQTPFPIKDVFLLKTLDQEVQYKDHEHLALWEFHKYYQYLGDSLWCKRGWTLQEKIFSGRALIFTPKQVYWECQRATWCEDSIWETKYFPIAYRHCFGDVNNFRRPWSLVDPFNLYQELVEEYSERGLTHHSDGLDAFAGILNALGTEAGQQFIWALPTAFFEDAFLWEYYGSPKRRLGTCPIRFSDGRITRCDFPSWSWLGWEGKVEYQSRSLDLIKREVTAIFYYLDGNGTLVQAHGVRNHDPRTEVTHKDILESVFALNIASNLLFFWGETAKLQVGRKIEKSSTKYGAVHEFLDRNCEVCELHWCHPPEPDLGPDELVEFVVIGIDEFGDVIVLLIDQKDTGVAYRRGLTGIERSTWEGFDSRAWKMISLG